MFSTFLGIWLGELGILQSLGDADNAFVDQYDTKPNGIIHATAAALPPKRSLRRPVRAPGCEDRALLLRKSTSMGCWG